MDMYMYKDRALHTINEKALISIVSTYTTVHTYELRNVPLAINMGSLVTNTQTGYR